VRLRDIVQQLIDIDWCIGYELTTEQMEALDEIRTDCYIAQHAKEKQC